MSVPMAMPEDFALMADFSTPSYFIYRDCLPGEPFDPTAPLKFFPAKDSDELFDALRAKYPHVSTHAERMRDATIEFLIEERNAEALQASPAFTMDSTPTLWPSGSTESTASFNSSPELYNFATPNSFEPSPASSQTAACTAAPASNASTSGQSPPSLDQMTGVFSIATSAQPKPRVRRKMTAAERVEYRNRRLVKACDKCAKRKRKCIHDQPATQASTPSATATKMAKSSSSSSSSSSTSSTRAAKPAAYSQPPRPSFVTETSMMTDISQYDMSTMHDSGSFGDIAMGFDDVMDDFDFNGYYDVEFKSDNRFHQWSRNSGSGFSNEHFSPTQALPDFQLFDNSPAPSAYNDNSDTSQAALQSFPSLVPWDQQQESQPQSNNHSGVEGSSQSQQATNMESETIHTTNKPQSKNTRSSRTAVAGQQNLARSSEQQSAAQAYGLSRWDARGHNSPSDDIPLLENQRLDGSTRSSNKTTSRSTNRDHVAHATTQNIPTARVTSRAETNDNVINSASTTAQHNIDSQSDKAQHQPPANGNVRTGRSAAALEMYSLRRRVTTGPQSAANNDRASLSIAGMPGIIGLIGIDQFGHVPSTNAPVLQTTSRIRAIANTDRNASSSFSGDVPGDAAQATSQTPRTRLPSGGIAVARSLSSIAPSPMRSRSSPQGSAPSVHAPNAGLAVSSAISPTVPGVPRLRDIATERREPTHNLHTHAQAKAELALSPGASPSLQLQAPVNTAAKLRLGSPAPRPTQTDKASLSPVRSLPSPASAPAIAPTVHLQGLVAATTPYTPKSLSTSVPGSALPTLLVLAACASLPVLQAATAASNAVVLPSATALAFVAVLGVVLGFDAPSLEGASMVQSKNKAWSRVSRAVTGARKTATAVVHAQSPAAWALRSLTAVMV